MNRTTKLLTNKTITTMKKRLLLMFVGALCASATINATGYNVGDRIYTKDACYAVTAENLLSGGLNDLTKAKTGTALSTDTFGIYTTGGPNDGAYMKVLIGGNYGQSGTGESENVFTMSANFLGSVPVTANNTYVVTYKVKSYLGTTSTTSTCINPGRNKNYQEVYFNTNGDTDRSTAGGYVEIANWVTYGSEWTEFSYSYTPTADGFINFLFYNLQTDECFADFGVYEVSRTGDLRNLNAFVNRVKFYQDNADLFPEGQDVITDILGEVEGFIDGTTTFTTSDEDALADYWDEIVEGVLDANTVDAGEYYKNFTFDNVATKAANKGAAEGWTCAASRFGIAAATGTTFETFTTNHVIQDISCASTYALSEANYYQTVPLAKGKYLYGVQFQGYTYFKDGTGSKSNFYIPNYYNPKDSFAYFVNSDTVWVYSVPCARNVFSQHVFEVAEDGNVTIGFHSPGSNAGEGGHYAFDNVILRRIGTESIDDVIYGIKVADAKYALKVMIDSAKVVITKDEYIFGRDVLQDSINVADERYALDYASSEASVTLLTAYMTQIRQAIRDYYTTNQEYVDLGATIEEATALINSEEGQKRPTGKETFQAAIDEASTYYNSLSVGSDRDSTKLVDLAAAIEAAKTTWYMANASVETPAEAGLVNGSFKDKGTSWTLTGSNTSKSKYGANSLFDDGYCYYYNRGYTATDYFNLYQDVAITETGVYKFTAQCMANNETWNMSGDDWSSFNTYTYLYSDTDSTYVITKGVNTKNSYNPGTDVQWFSATSKVSDLSTLSAGSGLLRVGIELRKGNTVNLVYMGSCHLYYYGSIADYETGIVTVKDITNQTLNGSVYNLSGLKVGNSLNGLSKGIYIMNGKKYVVK